MSVSATNDELKQDSHVVKTAVFLCDQWLYFDSATARVQWAKTILQQQSSWQLSRGAKVEVIVGRCGHGPKIQTNMQELLKLMLIRQGLDVQSYQIVPLTLSMKQPNGHIWGMLAVDT